METSSPTPLKLKQKSHMNGSIGSDNFQLNKDNINESQSELPSSGSDQEDVERQVHSLKNGCEEETDAENEKIGTNGNSPVQNKDEDEGDKEKECNGESNALKEESQTTCDNSESLNQHDKLEEDLKKATGNDNRKNGESDCVSTEESVVGKSVCDKEEKNDSEKENKEAKDVDDTPIVVDDLDFKSSKSKKVQDSNEANNQASDDVEIIGESKVVQINKPSSSAQNLILMQTMVPANVTALPMLSTGFPATSSSLLMSSANISNSMLVPNSSMTGGYSNMNPGFILPGGMSASTSQSPNATVMAPSVAPPKPKSSLDQIELIRWEIQNRINTRPKYFKPNPSAELGPLAKFLFDIGSDLIKESVYHELVKIQAKKNDEDKLTDKEKEDLEKLKEIEKDLHATIGHLKLRMKKRCRTCNFQTESSNVIYHHKQYPHEENKSLRCSHCPFTTKQVMNYKFHIESEHNMQPRTHDKKAFYECDLCPYENNQEQKLTLHKQRCVKQFRPLFNLHPSCLSGAEINLCLENIFYKPVVPKNLKLLQQKHVQQQAALAEARRQHAQVQALAAQKNFAAMSKRQTRPQVPIAPRFAVQTQSSNRPAFPSPASQNTPQVRYNARQPTRGTRPTVASMLKDKQTNRNVPPGFHHPGHAQTPGGFEVCEICGGYVKDRKALRIHFFYAHRIDLPFNLFDRNQPPLYCATCYVRFWTAQGLRKHIDVHAQEKRAPAGIVSDGVSGKCISCGHLVDNIVVHMRVVHMREIHHYVNALMCIFCGASFNSRQAVEGHIESVHGVIDRNTGAVKASAKTQQQAPKHSSGGPKKSGSSNNSLVKGSVCVLCNLNFGRNVDLTRHCMRMHHTCMKCGMVVIDKPSLLKHTCLSSATGTRDCTMCRETGFHPAYFVKHLRDKHLKKFSIKVAKVSPTIVEKWTKRPFPFKEQEEVLVEISDSSSEEEIISTPAPKAVPSNPLKKKVRIGPACAMNRPQLTNGVETTIDIDTDDNVDQIKTKDIEKSSEDGAEAPNSDISPSGKRKQIAESDNSERLLKRKRSA